MAKAAVPADLSQRNFRLRLPEDCDGLQFLQAIYKHPKIDLDVRIEAAVAALPYQKPRLVAFVQQGLAPTQRIEIVGGLPRLPGSETQFPGDPPAPMRSQSSPKSIVRETEVGTCAVIPRALRRGAMRSWPGTVAIAACPGSSRGC
jgi:hypothetical protein